MKQHSQPTKSVQSLNQSDPGKSLSIIGIILGVLLPPIGLLLSIIGISQSKKAGHRGTIGVLGVVVGIIFSVSYLMISFFDVSIFNINAVRESDKSDYFAFSYPNENTNFTLVPYTDSKFNVTLNIPDSWAPSTLAENNDGQTFILPKLDNDFAGGALEAISIQCKDAPGSQVSKDGFYKEADRAFVQAAKDKSEKFKSIENVQKTTINSLPAYSHTVHYSGLVDMPAAPGTPSDIKGTTFYHTWYLMSPSRICSMYIRAIEYNARTNKPSPVLQRAAEISQSFKSAASN